MFVEGTQLGRYRLVRPIGKGGFGVVWVARDTDLGRDVALKLLLPEHTAKPDLLERFLREARSAARIGHPGIVTVHEVGTADGTWFIAMELLKGESLEDRNRRTGALPVAQAASIVRQIAAALAAAHEAGIVHRDIKPDNVFLVPDPESASGERVKLLDFGIAKLAEPMSNATQAQLVIGTPRYMSPEQCRSSTNVTPASDIYSLGVMLFELLSGERPFDGEPGALIALHQVVPPPTLRSRRGDLPADLEDLVGAMLAKQPDQRPALGAITARLDAYRSAVSAPRSIVAAPPPQVAETLALPDAPRVAAPAPRRRTWLFVAVPAVLAAIALVAFVVVPAARGTSKADKPDKPTPSVDEPVPRTDIRIAMTNPYNRLYETSATKREATALAMLVRRELLARDAGHRGIDVTDEAVTGESKRGHFYYGGYRADIDVFDHDDDSGVNTWNKRKFDLWVRNQLGVDTKEYLADQRRGFLAYLVAEDLAKSVTVTRDEARLEYERTHATVTYDVLTFDPKDYLVAAPEDVARYLAAHRADVKARYERDLATYRAVKPQLRLRWIRATRETLDRVSAEFAAGKMPPGVDGGDYGWRPVDKPELGDAALDAAVRDLRKGDLTHVVTENGPVLIACDGRREGDLTYDDVELDIAGELARATYGREAAKRGALSALAQARGKKLRELYRLAPIVVSTGDPKTTRTGTPAEPPSTDTLPMTLGKQPRLEAHGPLTRDADLPGLGGELVDLVFDKLAPGELADRVYDVDGAYVVVQLVARDKAAPGGFDDNADELIAALRRRRAAPLVGTWLRAKCDELAAGPGVRSIAELDAPLDCAAVAR